MNGEKVKVINQNFGEMNNHFIMGRCVCVFYVLFLSMCVSTHMVEAKNKKAGKLLPYSYKEELEALSRLDKLPTFRTDCLIEQISSYDTTGGNDDGFSGKYSYLYKENGKLVIADLKGPGVINRIWTPTPTSDTLEFYFDGEKQARLKICFNDLFSGKVYPFVKPVCGNEVGGYYCYLPIPYRKSCKVTFSGEKLMFQQIQYRSLPGYDVTSFTGNYTSDERAALEKACKIWTNITPVIGQYTEGLSEGVALEEKSFTLQPGDETVFFEQNVPGRIVGFEIDGGNSFEGSKKDVLISSSWDGEAVPAIYAPIADFFGYAYGKGAMRNMMIGKYGTLNYDYIPCPYDRSAQMKLIYKKRMGEKQNPIQITTKVYYNQNARDKIREGKFYASWRREIYPKNGEYYEFANLKGKGHYVGTVHLAQGLKAGMTGFFEGDDSTYVDGKMRMHGTGSEDYYNGGWYALLNRWDHGVSLPIHGCLDYSLPMSRTGGYRFYMADKLTFEKEFYIGIEHGAVGNTYPVDYTSVAYYYSDTPKLQAMEPTDKLRELTTLSEHIYYPALMNLSFGHSTRLNYERGLRISSPGEGYVRIMLDDVPEGRYKVFISYYEKPDGADFRVWQRQKLLVDWRSSTAEKEKLKEKVFLNEIDITYQTNSITIQTKGKNSEFELDRVFLVKIQ